MPDFERGDWTLFRSLETIGQRAGVQREDLAKLVAKELTDNALDALDASGVGGECEVGLLEGNSFYVQDNGPGMVGDDARIAELFSFGRDMVTSKLVRLPTRGALGNGLRVVAGAVLASGGFLVVSTHGRSLRLDPLDDGTTAGERIGEWDRPGTRVEVTFGPNLPVSQDTLKWAREAIVLAGGGERYTGGSSPWWYDSGGFFDLLNSAKDATLSDVLKGFDKFSSKGQKIAAKLGWGRRANSIGRDEAERILEAMRRHVPKPFKADRLGAIGLISNLPRSYAKVHGSYERPPSRGRLLATIPYVVEVWADFAKRRAHFRVSVNRTPIAADTRAYHEKNSLEVYGCGLDKPLKPIPVGIKPVTVWVNVETPYMPITTDGKAPDLGPLSEPIFGAIASAVRRLKNGRSDDAGPKKVHQNEAILACLDEGIAHAGGGARYTQRQLFYAIRDIMKKRYPGIKEPTWDWFCQVITDHEDKIGHDLDGITRDNRGVLYEPHTGRLIPIGTRTVEEYERPGWTFNKVLYCEKEGFFDGMIAAKWPERHDCALLTSKGFATRAARDVIDLMSDTGEKIQFFCVHDGDASGTLIYQALNEATKARPERAKPVVNLGLEPWDGLAMGLSPESVERKSKTAAVAEYVRKRDREEKAARDLARGHELTPEEEAKEFTSWERWLQSYRVELNAMTTPQFMAWLDKQFDKHVGRGPDSVPAKVIPSADVQAEELKTEVRRELRRKIKRRVLRRAKIGRRVEVACHRRRGEIEARIESLGTEIADALSRAPQDSWRGPIARIADELAEPRKKTPEPS